MYAWLTAGLNTSCSLVTGAKGSWDSRGKLAWGSTVLTPHPTLIIQASASMGGGGRLPARAGERHQSSPTLLT